MIDITSLVYSGISLLFSVFKYTVFAILLLNISSFPTIWHIRFWWADGGLDQAIYNQANRLAPLYYNLIIHGRKETLRRWEKGMRERGSIGARVRTGRRATPDDCDFNMHLSNSCYAKSADHAMSAWSFGTLTPPLIAGAYQAVGGSHYTFIREIPIGSEYFMESRIAGWGDKWYYLVTEFIIYPKRSKQPKRSASTAHSSQPESQHPQAYDQNKHGASIRSPITSGTATPVELAIPGTDTTNVGTSSSSVAGTTGGVSISQSDLSAISASVLRSPKLRTDGGVVVAYGVHELCFKIGRITVPPRIAFHLALHSPNPAEQSRALQLSVNKKVAAKWLSGGWRDAADAETIGRDIAPNTWTSSGIESKEMMMPDAGTTQRGEWAGRVVRGMHGVSVGLGELVTL